MLRVHRAERASTLADALAEVLAVPLADPMMAELIAVPAKGVERWLTHRLCTRLGAPGGIAANIEFPSTQQIIDQAVGAATGIAPQDDPWDHSRLVWTLLGVIDDCLPENWCTELRTHLSGEHRAGRRYATAEHLAKLFRDYADHRPEELAGWVQDDLTRVPSDLLWQARLWQRLRERIGQPSPPERLPHACSTLRREAERSDLPERLNLFGLTRLTNEQLQVLDVLAAHREVHLWLAHPSPMMWQTLAAHQVGPSRASDDSALAVTHPLLASLARESRELQHQLRGYESVQQHHDAAGTGSSLLVHLQQDVRSDRPPSPTDRDGSIEVHACHGPARQVEVLRESLLHVFTQDPTLQPRDVLVMCPDVETYAPLVRAAFGQGQHGQHPGHQLRVRLADRSLRQTNPVLNVVASLLELADARVTASQLLDLAAQPPVRRRFGFGEDDLERLRDWASSSGVRWGINQVQREAFGLPEIRQNTWSTGLDRILLGVSADETDLAWLGNALPLEDVDSGDIELAGSLAELVDRVQAALWRLRGPQPATAWTQALSQALEWLADVSESDTWQLAQARRELSAATEHAGALELHLADVRAMLSGRLTGRPTRANFRTGELTVCTMVPMRSVPHRVVCLLGLDDEVFPRGGGVDGDDLLARAPQIGERDRRTEDRQLLLDALMSAGERLMVFYSGADPVTGQHRPPAVPLGEVLDVLSAMTGIDLVRRHPLQPFDPSNFVAPPFSHDSGALAGARASLGSRRSPMPFLPGPLNGSTVTEVSLADLVAFVQHPVAAFLRQRLGVWVPEEQDEVTDALRVELDGLSKWDVGDRWLQQLLTGVDIAQFRAAEWRRGTLPPGRLGIGVLAELEQAVQAIAEIARPAHQGRPAVLDVSLDLGDRLLVGTLTGVYGSTLAATSYSRLAAKHRLPAWVRLLTAAATRPGDWRAVTTGKGWWPRQPTAQSVLTAPADPLTVLRELVGLREQGLCEPLPIATSATSIYADRRRCGSSIDEALEGARKDFESRFGECTDRHLAYVQGGPATLEALLREPGDEREPSRFGVLARRLWEPLLAAETI